MNWSEYSYAAHRTLFGWTCMKCTSSGKAIYFYPGDAQRAERRHIARKHKDEKVNS